MDAEDFRVAVQRLLAYVGHWETGRWAVAASRSTGTPQDRTRGDVVHTLVQGLADLTADADNRPHRVVPREPDMVLPDQLKVMADDLLTAEPDRELLERATASVREARAAL